MTSGRLLHRKKKAQKRFHANRFTTHSITAACVCVCESAEFSQCVCRQIQSEVTSVIRDKEDDDL